MAEDVTSLDLDALLPESRTVILKGVEYEVQPPTLKVLPELTRKLDRLSKLSDESTPEETGEALEAIIETVRLIIPELPADTELNALQIKALFSFVMDMVTPPEQRALKEEGILPDSPKETASVS